MRKDVLACFGLVCGMLLFSCSDAGPQIVSVQPVVVLSYEDYVSAPRSSISVFVLTASAPQRAESVVVRKSDSALTWHDARPQIFTVGTSRYVCSRNIRPARRGRVQNGRYELTYTDSAGNEAESSFAIAVDERALVARAEDVRAFFGSSVEFVAVYDKADTLLYFSTPKPHWTSDGEIVKELKTASSKRTCFLLDDNTVLVMLPLEALGG